MKKKKAFLKIIDKKLIKKAWFFSSGGNVYEEVLTLKPVEIIGESIRPIYKIAGHTFGLPNYEQIGQTKTYIVKNGSGIQEYDVTNIVFKI